MMREESEDSSADDLVADATSEPEPDTEAEISDLRAAAGVPDGWRRVWSARGLAGGQLTTRQRFWRGGSGAIVVLLALLVIFASVRAATAPATPPTGATPALRFVIPPNRTQLDNLACELDAAWAPDSSRFAILGYGGGCDLGHGDPGIVNLYTPPDTLVARLTPDETILQAAESLPAPLTVAPPGVLGSGTESGPLIFYRSLLWSPDGRQLAISFTLVLSYQPFTGYDGVYLAAVAGGTPQVILTPDLSAPGATFLVWDLSRQQPLRQESFSSPSQLFPLNVPFALAYHWTSSGGLLPYNPGDVIAPAGPSPIGNPSGDSQFTLWQPSQIMLVNQSPNGASYPDGAYAWETSFSAWSPDGRYLLDSLQMAGRLQLPGKAPSSAATLAFLEMNTLPVLPLRDAGLRQALLSLTPTGATGEQSLTLAWRPDGKVLAATSGGDVTLYDCATGDSHAVPAPLPQGHSLAGTQALLRWSPDGRWLLLSDLRTLRME